MPPKNSQILLIENVLSSLNENMNERENTIKSIEEESAKLKNTITTLKHECKSAFNEQERLEDTINDLKKQNIFLSQEIKTTNEQLSIKSKEFDSIKMQHEQFMDNIEKRIEDFKQQLDNKNSIILELENINKELNKQVQNTQKDKKVSISKLERKLEHEEFKNFINTDDSYDFSSLKSETTNTKKKTPSKPKKNTNVKLDKLENQLKNTKKEAEILAKKSLSTEEEQLKKNLGF